MDPEFANRVRRQFGAALDMLENAIVACPSNVWGDRSSRPEFWYVAFHALFWADLYLHGGIQDFEPPPPFTLLELDPAGLVPETPYSKEELHTYLVHCRRRLHHTLDTLTPERANERRHVQHHAAQLNLMLRQSVDDAPPWVAVTAA